MNSISIAHWIEINRRCKFAARNTPSLPALGNEPFEAIAMKLPSVKIPMFFMATLIAGAGAAFVYTGELYSREMPHAVFLPDGTARLPVGYRQWSHIGTRVKSEGTNILDGLPMQHPEVLNAYVEPTAMASYVRDGKWPDGTQMVKEFSSIELGPGCDEKSGICDTIYGKGIFESGYIGLGMMIKDSKRFPNAAGNWGYFSFGHKPPPYDASSPLRPQEKCSSCHEALASDTDYVFVPAHIGLFRGKVE